MKNRRRRGLNLWLSATLVAGTLTMLPAVLRPGAAKADPLDPSAPAPMTLPADLPTQIPPAPPFPHLESRAIASPGDTFTPYAHDVINSNGTHTLMTAARATFFQSADGTWHDIDVSLVPDGNGGLRARAAAPSSATFGVAANQAVSVGAAGGRIALAHPGSAAVGATVADNRAMYVGALPGLGDLVENLTVDGFEEQVVMRSATSAAGYTDTLTLPAGVTARNGADGVEFVDGAGMVIATFSSGSAYDSAAVPARSPVSTALVSQVGSLATVSVTVDSTWYHAGARVFPVTIDPSFYQNTSQASALDTYVDADYPTAWYNGLRDQGGVADLHTGNASGATPSFGRTLLHFDLGSLVASRALASEAHLMAYAYTGWGGACSGPVETHLSGLAAPFSGSQTWNNQPPSDKGTYGETSVTTGYSHGCGTNYGWTQMSTTSLVNRWLGGSEPNYGIELQGAYNGDESHNWGYKEFYAGEQANDSAPALYITYVAPPSAPQSVTAAAGDTQATVQWAPPADNGGSAITNYSVKLFQGSCGGTLVYQNDQVPSTASSWTVGNLTNNVTYCFSVAAFNAASYGPPANSNNVIPQPSVVPPGPPTALSAAPGIRQATVSWSYPASDGGARVSSYTLTTFDTVTGQVGSPINVADNGTPSYSATVTGLTPGRSYFFKVRATNTAGSGPTATSNTVVMASLASIVKSVGLVNGNALDCASTGAPTTVRTGELAVFCIKVSNPQTTTMSGVTISDPLPAGLDQSTVLASLDGVDCLVGATCSMSGGTVTASGLTLAAGQTRTLALGAVATGSGHQCVAMVNTATATNAVGASQGSATLSVCDPLLGLEPWWSYTSLAVGPQSNASVNASGGNLVVQATDTTPVQARGRLAYDVRRTYNSQDAALATLPGSLGGGWLLNLGQADDLIGSGVGAGGLEVPPLESLTHPLAVTLVDRDGTRHLFRSKGLSAALSTSALSGALGALVPRALKDPQQTHKICVDESFSPPPGVHLGLWRYVSINGTGSCASPANAGPVVIGYAAERPDRLRYEYAADGHLLDIVDGSGVELRYSYTNDAFAGTPLGRLRRVFEGRCTGSPCRQILFSYSDESSPTPACPSDSQFSSGSVTCVTDPAGRLTRYVLDGASPVAHLVKVVNPDGSIVRYSYGGCGGTADQMCSITDPKAGGPTTTFTYAAAPEAAIGGQPQLVSMSDRVGNVTAFSYPDSATTYVDQPGNRRRQFALIDAEGRVGEIDEGTQSGAFSRITRYTWDVPGVASSNCRLPDTVGDNDLCRLTRVHGPTDATPDEVTTFGYSPEGRTLFQRKANGGTSLDTTTGDHVQYVDDTGASSRTYDDTVAGGGQVTTPSRVTPSGSTSLFSLSDETQSLQPRGNAAGSAFAPYLTAYQVDDRPDADPNAVPSPPAGRTICDSPATPLANTGAVCETDRPDRPDGAHAASKATYDTYGAKLTATTPRGGVTTYAYYPDTDTDLSATTSAGGWLRGVTDATSHFVAFAYDAAGNVAWSWDRNATAAAQAADPARNSPAAYPGPATSGQLPASFAPHAITLHGGTDAASTSTYASPWRYVTVTRDPIGNQTRFTLDADGNQLVIHPPRGEASATAAFDVTQTFRANDQIQSQYSPLEGASKATTYGYDAVGNRTSLTDPRGNVTAWDYDVVNRMTAKRWTRGPWPSNASSTNVGCSPQHQTTSQDAPLPVGRIMCEAITQYDALDNVTSTQDANLQVTQNSFDAVHRETARVAPAPRDAATVRAETLYDPDGHVTDVCSPRQFSSSSPTCTATSAYAQHMTYDVAGRVQTKTTYRDPATAETTTFDYDPDGNGTTVTDAGGGVTRTNFDLLDRRVTQSVPRAPNEANSTTWIYDPSGDVVTVIKPGSFDPGSGTTALTVGAPYSSSNPYLVASGSSYSTITLTDGAWIAPTSGGALDLHVTGAVSVCATCGITVAGRGPSGGAGGAGIGQDGSNGSNGGLSGTVGGGGKGAFGATAGGGGGGAGHAGNAANPGAAIAAGGAGGSKGVAYGPADLSDSQMGSGGGGGGAGPAGASSPGAKGGSGGGFVHLTASSIDLQGVIDASGAVGHFASTPVAGGGGGGGGSGGSVWLTTEALTTPGGGQILTAGGPGGPSASGGGGGRGAAGAVRIDTDGAVPASGSTWGSFVRRYLGRVTAYSYDVDNRVVDTVVGADSAVADQAGFVDSQGGINVRTRVLYDPDGHTIAEFAPGAFATSTTTPNPAYMVRTDYDADGRPLAQYTPRFDNAHSDLGAGSGGIDTTNNTQASQCSISNRPANLSGVPNYGSDVGVCVTRAVYSFDGHPDAAVLPTAAGDANRQLHYAYSDDLLVSSVSGPDPSSDGSQTTLSTTLFDGAGRAILQTGANGDQSASSYFGDGSLKATQGQAYTLGGATVTHVTTYAYDDNAEPTVVTDPMSHPTTTAYAPDGLRTSVTDGAGGVTSYAYDPVGNPLSVWSPSANAHAANNSSGTQTRNTFTLDNLLASTTVPVTPDGATVRRTTYGYDKGGRKISQHVEEVTGSTVTDGGTQSFSYRDDDRQWLQVGRLGEQIRTTFDPAGHPTAVTDTTSGLQVSSSYYLDGLVRDVNDGDGRSTQYSYDGAGNRAARADAAGSTKYPTTYTYNDAGLPTSARWNDPGASTAAISWTYDKAGRPLTQVDAPISTTTSWAYNPDDTLHSQATVGSASADKGTWTYTYNNDAQQLTQQFTQASLAPVVFSYDYDQANRLKTFSDGSTTKSITWDPDGNRLTYGSTSSATYRADDSVASVNGGAPYTYKPFGGLAAGDGRVYCYDGFDRLAQTSATAGSPACSDPQASTYSYDGLDRQRSHAEGLAGTTKVHYDGLGSEDTVEVAPSTNLATDYELSPHGRRLVANRQELVGGPTTQYLFGDGQGNITTGVTPAGGVACAARFDPFGTVIGAVGNNPCGTGSSPNDHFYGGGRLDSATGNYQMGARTYDPSKASFLSPDSSRGAGAPSDLSVGSDPMLRNNYAYVNGDPVNLTDPSGHYSCAWGDSSQCRRDHHWPPQGVGASNAELSKSNNYTAARDLLMSEVRHGGVPRGTVFSPEFLRTPEIFNFLLDNRILPVPQTFLDPCAGPAGIGVLPCRPPHGQGYAYGAIASRWFNSEVRPAGEITLAALALWSAISPSGSQPPPGDDQEQLQGLRQQFADLLHQRNLGFDPEIGQWRADEARAGLQLEAKLGERLSRSVQSGADWETASGRTYDAIFTNLTSDHFDFGEATGALERKLGTGATDRIVVDASQLNSTDADQIRKFISGRSPGDQAKIVFLGGSG